MMAEGAPEVTPLVSVALRNGDDLTLWPDRVATATSVFPLAHVIGVVLVADPLAPLLPNGLPVPAVQLRLASGQAPVFTPADPPDAYRLLDSIYTRRPDLRWAPPPPSPFPPVFPPPSGANPHWSPPGYAREDNTLAGLAHLSVFFAPLILPLIVWLTQRNTSHYAAQQGKQAFFWHLLIGAIEVPLVLIPYVAFLAGLSNRQIGSAGFASDPFAFLGSFLLPLCLAGLLGLLNIIFSIIGAVRAFRGEAFHYPLLGGL
jgi:uncharacterized Tic20 family protein